MKLFIRVINTATFASLLVAHAALPEPLVEIKFDGASGLVVDNTGSLGGTGDLIQTDEFPAFSTLVPPGSFTPDGNTTSINFGAIAAGQGGRAIDFTTSGDGTLGPLNAFTITGWLNPNSLTVGPGGNRIVFALQSPNGPGIDLVHLANGALRIGINQWPDGGGGGGPSSSSGRLKADAQHAPANWVFFAVTYDSAVPSQNVKYYFGALEQLASLDSAHNYKGGIADTAGAILATGPLTLGNFGTVVGARTETGASSRVFRGLMDEIQIFDRALDLAEVQSAQLNGETPQAPIVFQQQPMSQTVFAGAPTTLTARTTGSAPITYRWQRDGVDIPNATGETYFFDAALADNGVSFRVIAENSLGPVASSPAILSVLPESGHKLSLSFSGGATVTNLGNLEGSGQYVQTTGFPAPSDKVPTGPLAPTDNIASVDFGLIGAGEGGRAIDLTNRFGNTLGGMYGFTLSGWLNSVDLEDGPGGNRILFALSQSGSFGLDLVQLPDGSLQLGVNQFPDNSPARSSAGWITADPSAGADNWVFFAVTYDSTATAGQVRFYFGSSTTPAALDLGPLDYNRGLIPRTGSVTIGNFASFVSARTAAGRTTSRVFRGLIDEINFFNEVFTEEEIRELQKRPAYKPAVAQPIQITQQPQDALVFENQNATFSIALSGTPPFTIQWQKNQADIPGETTSTLTVPATLADNGAKFRAVVGNAAGSTTSDEVTLTVQADTGIKVALSFSEDSGTTTANAGDLGGIGTFVQRDGFPIFSENVPSGQFAPITNDSSVDFGAILAGQSGRAIDFVNSFGNTLGSMTGFTVTGWLNARDLTVGSGGNRIVFGLAQPDGPGLDLVQLADGSLQLGVNEWPDGTPARSSAGWITADPEAGPANWVFFAVTYDGSQEAGNVNFYFGSATQEAQPDFGPLDYNLGPIQQSGSLTVGNFGAIVAARNDVGPTGSRVFRGLMDEIRIFNKVLLPQEILEIQKAAAATPPVTEPELNVSQSAGELVLQWDSAGPFEIQATDTLTNPNWTTLTVTPQQNGTMNTARIPIAAGTRFFRLIDSTP